MASATSSSNVDVDSTPRKSTSAGDVDARSKYIAQLKELSSLLQAGAIDERDYDDQKAVILKRL